MTQNVNHRLTQLEQRSPARGHTCEVVKCRPDGSREVMATFWTAHPVERILVKYGEWRPKSDIQTPSNSA